MVKRLVVALAMEVVVFGALLFGAAGTLRWGAGWTFLGLFGACTWGLCAALLRSDPALLAERMKSPFQVGQPLWDKVFLSVVMVCWCGWFVLMGLDAGRHHWSALPPWLQVVGAAGFVAGNWIMLRAMQENTFTSAVIRVQTERGHHVISTGPYAIVRHPMYSGALVYLLSIPLILGSAWGVAAAVLMVLGLALRITREEDELSRHLPGYAAYRARVPYRLLPGLW